MHSPGNVVINSTFPLIKLQLHTDVQFPKKIELDLKFVFHPDANEKLWSHLITPLEAITEYSAVKVLFMKMYKYKHLGYK